ncbi:hypothetical protein ABH920_004906 [Catenulispora sp. EB89]
MLLEMNTSDSSHLIGIRLGTALAACLAAVTLTAGCSSSTSSGAKNAAGSATTTSAASAVSPTASSSSGSVDGGASPSTAAPGTASGSPKPTSVGAGGPRDCSTDMLHFSIDPVREPINHVLISATNTAQVPCHLNKYPLLSTFQADKSTIGVAQMDKPAAAILLAPGAIAYAGVMTNAADGSGTNRKTIPALFLQLQPGDAGAGGTGRPVSVAMPPSAQYIDSSAYVSYWESDMQSALY